MKLKRLVTLGSAGVLGVSTLLTISFSGIAHALVFNCVWTGAGNGTTFDDASNWTSCGNVDPRNGDSLTFDNTSLSSEPMINDNLSGLSVANVTFSGSNQTYSDQIGGDDLTVTGTITDSTQPSFPTGFANTVAVPSNMTIDTTNNNGMLLETLSGAGNVTVTGGGWLNVAGGTENLSNYTGTLSSTDSVIELATYADMTSTGTVAVSGNATLDLNFQGGGKSASDVVYNLPISLGGNGVGKDGALNLDGGQDSDVANTLAGPVTLTSDVQVTADGENTLDITGATTFNGHSLSSIGQNVTTINVPSGSNYSNVNPTVGKNVTYIDDGIVGNTTVANGGLLKGDGTLASATVETGGTIAPGHSPGCLTFNGDFTLSGSYMVDVQSPGKTACTDYDQLKVGGTVTLTGGSLNVVFLNGFKPAVGQSFEIVANNGSKAVVGTFNGLAQNDVFLVGTTKFQISYTGDGGHSVVLSVVSASTPLGVNTGFALTQKLTNPYAVLAVFTAAAGASVVLARRLKVGSK